MLTEFLLTKRRQRVVDEWPTPQNVTDIKKFLGLCSYYRCFVPNFATVAKLLIHLMEKNVPFVWSEEQEDAWKELKRLLTSAPVMAYPHSEAMFVLDTDTSQEWYWCCIVTDNRWSRHL